MTKDIFQTEEIKRIYNLGYDAGYNKPNTENCHFSIFSNKLKTNAWKIGFDRGKDDKLEEVRKAPKPSKKETL